MYSQKFLQSLKLAAWFTEEGSQLPLSANYPDMEQAPSTVGQLSESEDCEASNSTTGPPSDCLNCIHFDKADYCHFKNVVIDDPQVETSCPNFQRQRCKDCGYFEAAGYCSVDKIPKKPNDECEYDIRCFM